MKNLIKILFKDGWRYNPSGFDKIFLPLSKTCTKDTAAGVGSWGKIKLFYLLDKTKINVILLLKVIMKQQILLKFH